jgi:hypothetical protein
MKTSRLAVVSFILSLMGPMALFALPLALISLVRILMSRKQLKGIIYSILGLLFCGGWALLTVFIINPEVKLWAELEKTNTCRYNLRILGDTIRRYAESNGNRLPDAEKWCDQLLEFDRRLSSANFKHPKVKYGECNIAFNKHLGGQNLNAISGDTVMLFESDGAWNLNGGSELLNAPMDPNRTAIIDDCRGSFRYIMLSDGRVQVYIPGQGIRTGWTGHKFKPVRWNP